MPAIVIETGPLRGRRFRLPGKGKVTVGRDAKCALVLPDGTLADVQCALRFQSGRWVIENRDEARRTFVNDRRITRTALESDDAICLGQTFLTYVEDEEDPLLSSRVAGYLIEERIGRGAMGTVYRARQLSLDRPVAIKFLAHHLSRNEDLVRGFLQEGRAAARLNHPNVVQVHDAGREGEHYYISMEYLEKGTLENLLEKETRIAAPRAVAVATHAARALDYARQNGIVHRDIKPANLFIAADDSTKVGDLGIATDLRKEKPVGAGCSAGSPHFMAPEQIRGGEIDHRADIYALGCTLYTLISGAPPFTGATVKEILLAKLREDPVRLDDRMPDLPRGLSDVVHKMIARSPADRYSTAREVEEALTDPPSRSSAPVKRSADRPAPIWRNPGARLIAAVTAVLLVAVSFYLVERGISEPDGGVVDSPATPGETGDPLPVAPSSGGASDRDADSGRARRGDAPAPPDPSTSDEPQSIHDIYAAYDDGRLTSGEAQIRLRAIQRRNLDNEALVEEAHRLMQYVRDGVTSRMLEKEKAQRSALRSLIREGRLADAAKSIEDFKTTEGAPESLVAEQRGLLRTAVAEAIDNASAKIDALLSRREIGEARALLAEVTSRLPPRARSDATALEERIAELEATEAERSLAVTRKLAQGTLGIRHAVADFDFERATALLSRLEGQMKADARTPSGTAAPELALIRREVDSTQAVWTSLQDALQSRSRRGQELVLTFAEGRGRGKDVEDGSYRVTGVVGPLVTLRSGDEQQGDLTAAILALDADVLLELAGGADALPEVAKRWGLGMLLLFRRGTERATDLLLGTDLEPAELQSNQEALKSAGSIWLAARVRSAYSVYSRLRAVRTTVAGDTWRYLAEDLLKIHTAWRQRNDFREKLGDLRDIYAKIREEILLQEARDSFFHAARARFQTGGVATLTYDFRTPEQLLDFHPVGTIENALERDRAKASVRLRGEYRFLRGEPFQGFLRVSGSARVLAPNAPNLNLALWTREGDVVTFPDPEQIDLSGSNGVRTEAGDYFVVAHGYRLLGSLGAARRRGIRFDRRRLPLHFSQPSLAIICGHRGSTLHRDVHNEVIWQSPLDERFKSFVRFDVSMEEGRMRWTVNRSNPLLGADEQLSLLEDKAPYSGSFTVFTNGSAVVFSKLEIEGRIRPEWFRQRARVRAQEDAKRLGE